MLTCSLQAALDVSIMNSGPMSHSLDSSGAVTLTASSFVLDEVPTSRWTYGCSATSAGMIFGYYDRIGYSNMYSGPANGGVAPLFDLGENCSIIATAKGFDGRTTRGHVDDYWKSPGSSGPDPHSVWGFEEHEWGDCVADFMGTNQFKWDFNYDGVVEYNSDGATTLWYDSSGARLYDYGPSVNNGAPVTSLTRGMRLFAESRGYEIDTNYTQVIDTVNASGFTFADYVSQIDNGRPVMIQLKGHSMVGVGYDSAGSTVYVHNTWDNNVHAMAWGGTYSGMKHFAVTVIELAPVPETATLFLMAFAAVPVFTPGKTR